MHDSPLVTGDTVRSPISRLKYTVIRQLGSGGFGTAYLARRGTSHPHVAIYVCLKLVKDIRSWVSEAYFGYLLNGIPEAISVYDVFVDLERPDYFAVVSEYAAMGDLGHYLHECPSPWKPRTIRREVSRILRVLDVLHRGQALHRDLTPFNVFVFKNQHLKLGDFGIARHYVRKAGIPALTMAPWMAPREIASGSIRRWRARDDLYQVGQLLGMLVEGQAERAITSHDIPSLQCDDDLKEIIQRCIGPREKRFDTAGELIRRLTQRRPRFRESRIKSLEGKVVVFTGRLGMSRPRARQLAQRAGATVTEKVSANTDIVVRGDANPQQVAGDRGQKLIDVAMYRERGKNIRIMKETQFRSLIRAAAGYKR